MELNPIFSDDRDECLAHYGVMGMKWGVRNAETQRKYAGLKKFKKDKTKPTGYQSYHQAKKTIKKTQKAYKKETNARTKTTGKNVDKVDRTVSKAISNDPEYKSLKAKEREAEKKYEKAQTKHDNLVNKHQRDRDIREMHKENMIRLQNDPNASTYMRKLAEQEYLKDRDKARQSKSAIEEHKAKLDKAERAYDKAWGASVNKGNQITRRYLTQYKTAAVKDLGFDDVKRGKQILEDYGLMNYALGAEGLGRKRNLG